MEINFNNKDVTSLVIESLKEQKSLFVLRIGDGEMLYFDVNQERAKRHCEQTLGYILTNEELQKIRNDINDCIVNANVLGIPTSYHKKASVYWENIIQHYEDLRVTRITEWKCDNKFCSIDLHYELLQDDCFNKIFRETKNLFLVSPRDVKQKIHLKFPNIENIEQYLITGEQAYETIKTKSNTFLKQIEEIEKIINSKTRKGELLLYGAGFAGKSVGLNFSNSGGVAIDIGSVFDSWVGKITRGLNKGPETYTTPTL